MLAHKCAYCGNGQYVEIAWDGSITKSIGCIPYPINLNGSKPSKKLVVCTSKVDKPYRDECGREAKVSSFKALP